MIFIMFFILSIVRSVDPHQDSVNPNPNKNIPEKNKPCSPIPKISTGIVECDSDESHICLIRCYIGYRVVKELMHCDEIRKKLSEITNPDTSLDNDPFCRFQG